MSSYLHQMEQVTYYICTPPAFSIFVSSLQESIIFVVFPFNYECIFFYLHIICFCSNQCCQIIGLTICSVGSQAALSKLKEDLKHDPKLASQYGVIIKSRQTYFFNFTYFLLMFGDSVDNITGILSRL